VVDVLPLGGRVRIAVVRCYDRTFLVGTGEKGVTLLSELDGAIEPARRREPSLADARAFGELLARTPPGGPRAARPSSPWGSRGLVA
jgi:flagellar biogenesis protein FliO